MRSGEGSRIFLAGYDESESTAKSLLCDDESESSAKSLLYDDELQPLRNF